MSNSYCVLSGCKVSNKKCTYGFGGGIGGNTGGYKEDKHVEHVPVGQNYNHLKITCIPSRQACQESAEPLQKFFKARETKRVTDALIDIRRANLSVMRDEIIHVGLDSCFNLSGIS